MKYFDFLSGTNDKNFRICIWAEGSTDKAFDFFFHLGRGMKYFDFLYGSRDAAFRPFYLGRGMKYFDFCICGEG